MMRDDIKLALDWAYHIEHPCPVEGAGDIKNIRDFYIRQVNEFVLPVLKNPLAKEFLEDIVEQYST